MGTQRGCAKPCDDRLLELSGVKCDAPRSPFEVIISRHSCIGGLSLHVINFTAPPKICAAISSPAPLLNPRETANEQNASHMVYGSFLPCLETKSLSPSADFS